ncbi:N-6 DNA methylase [Sphaerisporangium sp. NPDC051017]|uniref:N-6 DNA methylase n=1 Tax=Sphaerisporangium sp. NPDC051017 TaxID=3154636 RepID=UPI0034251BA4
MGRDVQVTAADISRMGDVGRAAVSNWRRRHDDFPQPTGGTATSPVFSLNEIKQWLRSHAEGKELPLREWLWQDLRASATEEQLTDLIADLGAFLVYLDSTEDWGDLSVQGDTAVAAGLPERIPLETSGSLTPARIPLLRQLADVARRDGVKPTFAFLRDRYFELHTKRTYTTPEPVARLMAALSNPLASTVLDPACGSGTLLQALHDRPGSSVQVLLGQDIDEASARLTTVHLTLHGCEVDIQPGDSLRRPAFPGTAVDAVVGNPPFNDRAWGYEELAADPRWEYGLPPRTESELAWVQHSLSYLRPGGTAVLLMPPAAANRRSGRRIRAQLIRRGALQAVIALPLGSVPNTAVALHLWVLGKPRDSRTPRHVLMVDTSGCHEAFVQAASAAWGRFERGDDVGEPTVSRAVPVIDLLDEDVDLTPSRYLSVSAEDLSPERVTGQRDRMADLLRLAATLVPAVESATEEEELVLVPLTELVRRGMLTVEHQSLLKPGEASDVPDGLRVLMPEDILDDRPPTGTTPGVPVHHEIVVRRGDVVVPHMVHRPTARFVVEGGAILGPRVSLLRTDPEQLDPHFVAGFVASSINARHYTTLASRAQVDVRRADIPLLPIAEQRRYGEAFRRLAEFEASLRQAAALGEDLIQLISDGLTHGSVRPASEKGAR